MRYIKTFESYVDEDLISQMEFYKVPTGEKTVFKPSFGAKKVLDIYLEDEVFVRCTKDSKKFWQRVGATVVDPSDPYLLHFIK